MGRKFITYNGVIVGNGGLTLLSTETDTPTPPSFTNTKSIALDGVDDFVDMGDVLNMANDGTDAYSISCWFKTTSTATQMMIAKQTNASPYNGYNLYMSANRFKFSLGTLTTSSYINGQTGLNGSITDGNWHHVCLTYDGSQDISGFNLYYDGVNTTIFSIANNTPASVSNTTDFNISGRGSGALLFNGNIDEVSYFDSVLSASDVSTIFGIGLPNDISGLNPVGWWRCGDGDTAPTLTDNGSGGNNGTMTNFSTFSTDVPKFNTKSIALDGVDDYINVADNSNLSFGNGTTDSPFSISGWIKMDDISGFRLLNKYVGSTYEYSFGTGAAGNLQLYLLDSSSQYRARLQSTFLNTGQWYHIASTYDGRGGINAQDGIKIYVDGVRVDDTSVSVGSYIAMTNTTVPVYIGKLNTSYTDGNIDEVAIFNSELSQSDITSIYNGGTPNDISSLSPLSWWRCGDGDTSPILTDNGSGVNDGTMANFTTFSTDVPT